MNVLFLMADELAWWALERGVHTPNLDRLAARGVRFGAAYTPSPICVPTRAAIATGRWLHQVGYWSSAEPYDGRVPSWGHALRAAGVHTASIGKLHYRGAADNTGFAEQILPMHVAGEGWVRGLLRRPLAGYDATRDMAEDIGSGWTDYTRYDARVTAAAVDWLGARRAGERWCGFVSWVSPHYPLRAPEEDFTLYHAADYQGPAAPLPDHPVVRELTGFFGHDPWFTPETRGIARAAYRGLCTFLDRQVGAVLAALEHSGRADDTLVIFTSDHGEMLGDKGMWGKSLMYEGSARVPLILAGPGVAPGRRDDPVSLIDIAPTLAEAAGASRQGFSGRSLLAPPEPGRAVISEYHDGGASVGIAALVWVEDGRRWKYVHYAEGRPPQLFDLSADPQEDRDLSAAAPGRLAAARARLFAMYDPEDANARAHADQAARVRALGGRAALLARPQWNRTPTGQA